MRFTIDNILDLFVDKDMQRFKVYDLACGQTIFDGYGYECPDEYMFMEIESIDTICENELCFNVNTDAEY